MLRIPPPLPSPLFFNEVIRNPDSPATNPALGLRRFPLNPLFCSFSLYNSLAPFLIGTDFPPLIIAGVINVDYLTLHTTKLI